MALLLPELALRSGALNWPGETAARCLDDSTSRPAGPLPAQAVPQPTVHGLSQITRSLYISNGVVANSQLMLYLNHIITIINVSLEVASTFYEDIQYVRVPVADTPSSNLCDFFDPIADHIHSVEMKQGRTLLHCAVGVSRSATLCLAYLMKYHSMSLLDARNWTKSCHPIIRPTTASGHSLLITNTNCSKRTPCK